MKGFQYCAGQRVGKTCVLTSGHMQDAAELNHEE